MLCGRLFELFEELNQLNVTVLGAECDRCLCIRTNSSTILVDRNLDQCHTKRSN